MASVFNSILDETVTQIRAIGLPDCPDDHVIKWPIPDARTLTKGRLPAVFVGLTAEAEIEVGSHSTNLRDAIRYPVGIYTLFKPEPGQANYLAEVGQALAWRQMIRRTFHRTRNVVSGIDGGVDQTITQAAAIDPASWIGQGVMIGGLVLHVIVREVRDASP